MVQSGIQVVVEQALPGPDMKFHIIYHGAVEVKYQCPGCFHLPGLIKKAMPLLSQPQEQWHAES
jgi:hypothetical protein